MATASEHRKLRDMALILARARISTELSHKIPDGAAFDIILERLDMTHADFVKDHWRTVTSRERVNINWTGHRIRHRDKLDVSIMCRGVLCGVLLARHSRRRVNVNLRFLEGNPFVKANPIKGYVMAVALIVTESFALAYRARTVSISSPETVLIPRYRSYQYQLTKQDESREIRGLPVRGDLLVKRLRRRPLRRSLGVLYPPVIK
ncbi:hypothetical protein SRABI13_04479 [Erwinia aphidicola]|uniref:hypothetical protein n=1 Tax=Erwinia aphidicola TaxID=68334 RepID=UPI001D2A4987|nr:hypothetical protein [Erwinia aphidicola]CAH0303689.1 hypothetical protein SRABI13_04479 [Erwinia aphidicola]